MKVNKPYIGKKTSKWAYLLLYRYSELAFNTLQPFAEFNIVRQMAIRFLCVECSD